MEMTVGTVSAGTSSGAPVQQGASSLSDSGFSEILSGVRSAAGAGASKQPGTAGNSLTDRPNGAVKADAAAGTVITAQEPVRQTGTAEEAGSVLQGGQTGDVQTAQELTASAETVTVETVEAELEGTLIRLVAKLTNGNDDEKDKVIQALLDYLRKMQQEGGGDNVTELAMQLLMSMLGGQQTPSYELHIEVQNISAEVKAVSAEYSSMSATVRQEVSRETTGEEQETAVPFETADSTDILPGKTPQQTPEKEEQPAVQLPQETAEAPVMTEVPAQTRVQEEIPVPQVQDQTREQAPVQVQTQIPVQAETEEARQIPVHTGQAETRQAQAQEPAQTQEFSQETAVHMLDGILEQARKELGLVSAELTQTKAEPVQTAEQQPAQTSKAALEFRPNHKDGRNELDSILGAKETEKTDEPKKTAVPEQNSGNAGLAGSGLEREAAPVKESLPRAAEIPPERQLSDEIIARAETVNGGRTEFTMVLNPESLGRITVRLASTGGRIEVSITAENESTRQLLESRTEQLGSALRQNGVELERCQVVSGQENAQLMQDNYDGSSKNPYGRPDDEDGGEKEDNGEDFLEILQQI